MPKDKDVIKNEDKSTNDKEKNIYPSIDHFEENSNIPEPLNKDLEDLVKKRPKGFIGCGG